MAPVKLTDKDIDALIRVVATETDDKLVWSRPEDYTAQVQGVVDTILNRVASGKWGDTVEEVVNAKNQFSAINGPTNRKYKVYGSVDKVPDSRVPAFLPNIVTSWVTERSNGTPSSVGGNLHYANPTFSDPSNMGWINELDGPKLGYGKSTHWHGTTTGYNPVEAVVEYGPKTGTRKLQDIQDRNAAAQGYGALPPSTPRPRPAYFNETGKPPVPLNRPAPPPSLAERTGVKPLDPNMSPALQSARARLEAARQAKSGVDTPGALAVTPRLPERGYRDTTGISDPRPQLDNAAFRPSLDAGGVGSLLDGGINPATPNPVKPPVQGLRLPVAPAPAQTRDTTRMAVKAPSTGNAAPAAGRPGGATTPPATNTKIDFPSGSGNATAVPAQRTTTTAPLANGTMVEIGKSYIVGNKLLQAELGEDGKAVLRDVKDKIGNAGLLFENSIAGTVARGIAAPMVKQGLADAGNAIKDTVGNAASGVRDSVLGLAGQASDFISGLGKSATTSTAPKPATTNTLLPAINDARAAQQQVATTNTLAPKPITTTIRNPEYDAWVAKYGDGSQVQTAPTGGMVTANQLAAIQNVSGAVQKPIAPPPAPPKTITVTKPGNTLAAPVPVARPAAPQTFKGAGGRKTYTVGQTYIGSTGIQYIAQPDGTFQKVGTPTTNTLKPAVKTMTSTTPAPSSSSSTTSWGQSKTASDGTSWAANW